MQNQEDGLQITAAQLREPMLLLWWQLGRSYSERSCRPEVRYRMLILRISTQKWARIAVKFKPNFTVAQCTYVRIDTTKGS